MGVNTTINFGNDVFKEMKTFHINYASRHSRTRDAVKLTVCVCLCVLAVPAVTAQRLQCDKS